DRIWRLREYNRNRAGRLQQRWYDCAATSKDDVRRERDQFRRIPANALGIAGGPAIVNLHVAAVGPAQFLQPLHERSEACLPFRIAGCGRHEPADAPLPVGLLRARRERPRNRRAAEQRDELAPLHSITSSTSASSVGGTVRPSAFAVPMLMT